MIKPEETDDYDLGELYRDWDQSKKEKKQSNLQWSTQHLADQGGVAFQSKNGGVHLIVKGRDETIDFWPSTGKFICRKSGKSGRGVKNLLKHCNKA